jgi:hypothetical protein
MNVLTYEKVVTTNIVDMDADDRSVLRLALQSFLREHNSQTTRAEFLTRATKLYDQLTHSELTSLFKSVS